MLSFRYVLFVLMTIVFWGIYAPILHQGQVHMGSAGKLSRIEPLICVGIAYFMVAVLVPTVVLFTKGEAGRWSISGFIWSFIAGVVGSLGAVGMVIAMENNGNPVYVVPLVFGGAPVVNTIVTMLMNRSLRKANVLFYLGILLVAVGGAGIMFFKPSTSTIPTPTAGQFVMVIFGICLTALSWGAYGPILHRGQSKMGNSRWRPFICVGLAYFLVTVIMPLLLQNVLVMDHGKWNLPGVTYSVGAGAAGALGALGIIFAFNYGGRPIVVMPLVFGGVPIVNTLFEMIRQNQWGLVQGMFFVSLAMVIAGAVTVLLMAPRGTPHHVATVEEK